MKKIIDKSLDVCLVLILGTMSIIVAVNVFSRFVLNFSIYWGDELVLILFVWLTFLGAAVGIRERSHYALNYLKNRFSGEVKRYYVLVSDLLCMVGCLVLLYHSTIVAIQIEKWVMPALEISRSLVYGVAPVGCLLMLYYLILRIWEDFTVLNKKQHDA